jgi:hypothetical protein
VYFKLPCQYLSGGAEEDQEISHESRPPGRESKSGPRSRSATQSTATFDVPSWRYS